MIKKLLFLFLIIFILLSYFVLAEEKVTPPVEPVLITSMGQNPDGLMVKFVLDKNKVKNNYIELASSKDLDNYQSIIMAVGVSYKGLGAAGINYDYEVNRTRALVSKALKLDCKIILVHLGGDLKREKKSDQLIKLIAPYSSYMIVKESSNKDKYFTKIARERKIPLIIVDNLDQLETIFKNLYYSEK